MKDDRILRQPTKDWRRHFNARRIPDLDCPEPDDCCPCGCWTTAGKGVLCAGLQVDRNDLNMIGMCITSRGDDGEVSRRSYHMTPDEAVSLSRYLSIAVINWFDLYPDYVSERRRLTRLERQRERRERHKVEKAEGEG